MGNTAARDTESLDRTKRDAMACDLRRAGCTYQEIANALGMSDASVARDAIIRARKAIIAEPVRELVEWETERLDKMLAAIWPKVQNGNLQAIDRALKISARRSALLGLDVVQAPQVQVNVNGLSQFLAVAFKPPAELPEGATALPPAPLALDMPEPDPAFLEEDQAESPIAPQLDPDDMQ